MMTNEETKIDLNRVSQDAQHLESLARLVIDNDLEGKSFGEKPGTFASGAPDLLESLPSQDHSGDLAYIMDLSESELASYLTLANNHHVIVRAHSTLQLAAVEAAEKQSNEKRHDANRIADWCSRTLATERARISVAIGFLHSICNALESNGCRVAVIKSLDHWPDLGSDLDLCVVVDHEHIDRVMAKEFGAHAVQRSWGDRLAGKWNYSVPGLPELVEIHVQFLGQTGEHADLARRVVDRRVSRTIGEHTFLVAAPEERIIISALQRVYRHFYFRLCDMVDTASLLQSKAVDFDELRSASSASGIWRGVATFPDSRP